jgi:hypothetical protein
MEVILEYKLILETLLKVSAKAYILKIFGKPFKC